MNRRLISNLVSTGLGVILAVSALAGPGAGSTQERSEDLRRFFRNTTGAFVLYDSNRNHYVRYNVARCRKRFSPFSTFKIPNSVIGLETGVIADADFVISWDPDAFPQANQWTTPPFVYWKQDQTLRSAIKYSVVWYYRELSRRVGLEKEKKYVADFHYGNEDVSGGLSSPNLFECFWLRSSLQISADEQIEFLKRLYGLKLPVSARSQQITKDILVLEKTPKYTLSGKTGGGAGPNGTLGWFVGYVEANNNVYFFALNIDGPNYEAINNKRIDLTKQILRTLGCMPTDGENK
jgi:beta-lactamase class D